MCFFYTRTRIRIAVEARQWLESPTAIFIRLMLNDTRKNKILFRRERSYLWSNQIKKYKIEITARSKKKKKKKKEMEATVQEAKEKNQTDWTNEQPTCIQHFFFLNINLLTRIPMFEESTKIEIEIEF